VTKKERRQARGRGRRKNLPSGTPEKARYIRIRTRNLRNLREFLEEKNREKKKGQGLK